MGARLIDISGRQLSYLRALEHLGKGRWRFECTACGRTDYQTIGTTALKRAEDGCTVSCGCMRSDSQRKGKTTHGMSGIPEYKTWKRMICRCTYPSVPNYPNYGGRGIDVCRRWRDSFEAFYADMGPRPSPAHSIERDDSDGNYEPDNCRWATDDEQRRNKSVNVNLTFRGETRVLNDWVTPEMPRHVIRSRLKLGWTVDDTFSTPWVPGQKVEDRRERNAA